jgi:hypothetical protein
MSLRCAGSCERDPAPGTVRQPIPLGVCGDKRQSATFAPERLASGIIVDAFRCSFDSPSTAK